MPGNLANHPTLALPTAQVRLLLTVLLAALPFARQLSEPPYPRAADPEYVHIPQKSSTKFKSPKPGDDKSQKRRTGATESNNLLLTQIGFQKGLARIPGALQRRSLHNFRKQCAGVSGFEDWAPISGPFAWLAASGLRSGWACWFGGSLASGLRQWTRSLRQNRGLESLRTGPDLAACADFSGSWPPPHKLVRSWVASCSDSLLPKIPSDPASPKASALRLLAS